MVGERDLELELGILLNEWVDKISLEKVIEALHFYIVAFELREELAGAELEPPTRRKG